MTVHYIFDQERQRAEELLVRFKEIIKDNKHVKQLSSEIREEIISIHAELKKCGYLISWDINNLKNPTKDDVKPILIQIQRVLH